jgi:hypothetical protein
MVFISNPYDVTLTPYTANDMPALRAAQQFNTRMTFDQAAVANHIYQNNGLICQKNMCQSLTGCDQAVGCPAKPEDWQKVLKFCGPIGTQTVTMNGATWQLQPVDERQRLLTSTRQSLGIQTLPTAYNVTGMY